MSVFQKSFAFVQKRSAFVLAFFILLLGISTWGLKFSRLELDIYDVYDPDFQSSVDLSDIKDFFSDRSQMLVSFSFATPPEAGELCRLLKWSRHMTSFESVRLATSVWSIRAPRSIGDKVWYPKTLPDPCELPSESTYEIGTSLSESFFSHLLAKDGKTFVFDLALSGKGSDTDEVRFIIEETSEFFKDSPIKISYLGMASFRYHFKQILLKDSIYNILILLIIMLLMRFFFGTWRSGFFLSLTLVATCLVLYGLLALFNVPIDILTNNLFLMTAVAGTADFIFVSHYQLKGSYEDSFQKLIGPCFFTTLTTIIGFLSLNTSDLSIIIRFGNGAALGAFCEWLMMFFFLPSLLKILGQERKWVNIEKACSPQWIEQVEGLKLPKPIVKAFILLMVLSVPSFFFLNDYDSPVLNLPRTHELRQGYKDFKTSFSWEGQVYLLFPEVPDVGSYKRIMTSVKNFSLIEGVEDPEELASIWIKDLPPLRGELIRRELSMTPLWERYYSNEGYLRIPLYLKEQDLHSLRKFRNEVNAICNNKCRLAGQRVVYLEYGEKISRTMIESFGVSIILVLLIITWILWKKRKLEHLLPVILSSLMGPLVILSIIALFQIPVTLITSIFLAVMVGLAGDNAIHYLLAGEENLEEGIKRQSRASVIVTIVMILGSSMFMFQSLLPMRMLGLLFVLGFLINLIGDLWGLRSLLSKSH